MSRSSMRARVVLPQPDSPTMPSVSPRATVKLTPSTTVMRRLDVAQRPARRRRTISAGPARPGLIGFGHERAWRWLVRRPGYSARGDFRRSRSRRAVGGTARSHSGDVLGAPRSKGAAGRQRVERWNGAGNGHKLRRLESVARRAASPRYRDAADDAALRRRALPRRCARRTSLRRDRQSAPRRRDRG